MKDNTAWMLCYSTEHRQGMSYVTADGNYGSDEVLVFPYNTLTEKHWEVVRTLHDNDRLEFVKLIINGKDTSEYDDYL